MKAYVIIFRDNKGNDRTKFMRCTKKPGVYESMLEAVKDLFVQGNTIKGVFEGKLLSSLDITMEGIEDEDSGQDQRRAGTTAGSYITPDRTS